MNEMCKFPKASSGSGVDVEEPKDETVQSSSSGDESKKAYGVGESGIGSIPTPCKTKETRKRRNNGTDMNQKLSQRPRVKKHIRKIFDNSKPMKVPKAQTPNCSGQEGRMQLRKRKSPSSTNCTQKLTKDDVVQDVKEASRASISKRVLDFDNENKKQDDKFKYRYFYVRRKKKTSISASPIYPLQVYRRRKVNPLQVYRRRKVTIKVPVVVESQSVQHVHEHIFHSRKDDQCKELMVLDQISSGALVKAGEQLVRVNQDTTENGVEDTGIDTEEWWETQRRLFLGRVYSFIAKMHPIQGNMPFSPWKGSVTDSVVGAYLTQNVSDHLSSSAFMHVVARFPNNIEVSNSQEPVASNTQTDEGFSTEGEFTGQQKSTFVEEQKIVTPVCNQQSEVTIEQGVNNHKETRLERKNRKGKKKTTKVKKQEPKIDWEKLRKNYCKTEETKINENHMDAVDWEAVRNASAIDFAKIIEDRGMQNKLAARIKDFLDRIHKDHGTLGLEWLRDIPPDDAKDFLLSIYGLGLKSTECVRLLTLHHNAFPVDTNVGRVATRLGWIPLNASPSVNNIQKYLYPRLCTLDQKTLYELHYQLITFGKVFCTKINPNCQACPMKAECKYYESAFASRLALSGTKESINVTSIVPAGNEENPSMHGQPPTSFDQEVNNLGSSYNGQSRTCEPIVEVPPSPKAKSVISDIEDLYKDPIIRLNTPEFKETIKETLDTDNVSIPEADMSMASVSFSVEAAKTHAMPKKFVAKHRTMHLVYELPNNHEILAGFEKREHDPTPYLLAIWLPVEMPNSLEETVKATILIPCRTANRGTFPLNGTYFQVNEVFADDKTSHSPIDVPWRWVCHLNVRELSCGTSATSIFKDLSTDAVERLFWKGSICVRGFNRETRKPTDLHQRFHISNDRNRNREERAEKDST